MFLTIDVLKNFANLTGKQTPTEAFSCENCKIFKKAFFYRTPVVTANQKKLLDPYLGLYRNAPPKTRY